LLFPLGTFPKNSSRSVHVLFSYRGNRQTDRQTDRQTYAGDSIILAYAGIIIEEYAEHNEPNIDNEKQASQIPDILVVTRASIRRWTFYSRDVGTRYGPVSLCLSVTNRCFIKTAGKIELILAWRLLLTYHRPYTVL